MLKLLKYLKNYKLPTSLGLILKLLEATMELFIPLIMANIIDSHNRFDNSFFIKYGIVLLIIILLGFVFAMFCQYFASVASAGMGVKMRSELYKKINSYSLSQVEYFGTSSITNRITNDVNQVQQAVAMTIRLLTRAPFLAVGSLIMAFIINVKISIIFLVIIPIISLIIYIVMKKSIPLYLKSQKKLDKISAKARQNLEGARVVRAFSKQMRQEDEFSKDTVAFSNCVIKVNRIVSLLNPLSYFIINLSIVGVLYIGGYNVNSGNMQAGQIMALTTYLLQLLISVTVIANLIMLYSKASASARRINELIEVDSSEEYSINANNSTISDIVVDNNKEILRFNKVIFAYYGGKNVIEDINFTINYSDRVGIIGGTGQGKSTIVDLITRLYRHNSGNIFFEGQNIEQINIEKVRDKIAYATQKSAIFTGTIFENVAIGNQLATYDDVVAACKLAECYDLIVKNGMDYHLEQSGSNLSGGQKQRICLARAFVKKFQLLIIDDCLSALDYVTEKKIIKSIDNKYKDKTIIMVSQRVHSIIACDKIFVIKNGKIVGNGTHNELINNCDTYNQIASSQSVK